MSGHRTTRVPEYIKSLRSLSDLAVDPRELAVYARSVKAPDEDPDDSEAGKVYLKTGVCRADKSQHPFSAGIFSSLSDIFQVSAISSAVQLATTIQLAANRANQQHNET